MTQTRSIQGKEHDYPQINLPSRIGMPSGPLTHDEATKLAVRINDAMRELYVKLWGRIDIGNMNSSSQDFINSRLDGDGVGSWITQNPEVIENVVFNSQTYVDDQIYRGVLPPENPDQDTLWLDLSVEPSILRRWDGAEWVIAGFNPDDYMQTDQVMSLFQQTADQIALMVTRQTFEMENVIRSDTAPFNEETGEPEEGMIWLDTSVNPNVFRKFQNGAWFDTGSTNLETAGVTINSNEVTINGPTVTISAQVMSILAGAFGAASAEFGLSEEIGPHLTFWDDGGAMLLQINNGKIIFADGTMLQPFSVGSGDSLRVGLGIFTG